MKDKDWLFDLFISCPYVNGMEREKNCEEFKDCTKCRLVFLDRMGIRILINGKVEKLL